MSKHHSNSSQDMEKELTKFEKLVEVCRIARELYYQEKSQQVEATKQNSITTSGMVSSGEQVLKRPCKIDHDYLNDKKVSSRFCMFDGRRYVDDHDYLNDKKVSLDLKGKKKLRNYYDDEDHEYSEKKKDKYYSRNDILAKNKFVEIASLPLEFKNRIQEMGGDDVKLIIQKHLFAADTDKGQNRFSIPIKQVREDSKDFLTLRVPIEVPLIEPDLNLTQIVIRKWNYSNKSSSYTLSGSWSEISSRNNLQVGMEMQLWSFRVDGELNLALVKVLRDNEQDHEVYGIASTSQINAESHEQQHDIEKINSRNEADRHGGHILRDAAASTHDQMEDID